MFLTQNDTLILFEVRNFTQKKPFPKLCKHLNKTGNIKHLSQLKTAYSLGLKLSIIGDAKTSKVCVAVIWILPFIIPSGW